MNLPLDEVPYLILDARARRWRLDGHLRDCTVPIAVGVRDDGRRSVLGVSVSLPEAEVHWQGFSRLPAEAGYARHAAGRERSHEGLRAAREALISPPLGIDASAATAQRTGYVMQVAMRREGGEAIRVIDGASDDSSVRPGDSP